MKEEKVMKDFRKEIFLTACTATNAHLASSFSIVEIIYTLYIRNVLKIDAENPNSEDRDIFILSKGHGSLALYTALYYRNFFDKKILRSFAKKGSILGGEPCVGMIPGIEAATGSLGHGLSIGVGVALAKKLDNRDEKVYVLLGDGECQEGTIWEAVMSAAHYKLDNLITIVDCNKIQKMGTLEDIMSINSWKERFSSFGFMVEEVDGHDIDALEKCLRKENKSGKPKVILANTIKGKGVSIIENNPRWHWKLPNKKELKAIVEELNISEEELEECKKLI